MTVETSNKMPSKRESEDYTHYMPQSSRRDQHRQFTWLEALLLIILCLSYLLGYAIQISIIAEKYSLEDPPKNRGLYLLFFFLPHLSAGLKNLQYHFRESKEEESEDSLLGWIINFVFLPVSPLVRLVRAWRFGMAEKNDREQGLRFVDELLTAAVLRLFDVLLGDAPTLSLLLRDDVWSRSSDWKDFAGGQKEYLRCAPACVRKEVESNLDFWTVFRMFFLVSKMAQGVTSYLVAMKRFQRLQYPEYYQHLRGRHSRQGRLNIFATFLLYFANFFFIGSRIMGYSMVSYTWGPWVYLILGGHWLINSAWHLITILNTHGITAARSVSSLVMGGVWLFAITNEQGGRQLGRLIMYYLLAFFETAVCGFLWNISMAGSGDFFAFKASWALLAVFMVSILLQLVYYSLCHPGSPSVSFRGLLCCSGDRRDPLPDEEEEGEATPI
ncbi:uncharacterized protein LOC122249178 [Penaeus japonicus]|uniref:uncharacterized protein LOC122249178 n=1 Tax=Penaeus japonicus TaxID=27405 RepID=UPI001C7173C1|nr:uncharacterized protein LOC122249178 [Penaeus japonicus]